MISGRLGLLRPFLDSVAARFLQQRRGRRFDLVKARRQLRDVVCGDHGWVSFRFQPEDDAVISAYFDEHPSFERVSDGPQWEPRAKMAPSPEPDPDEGMRPDQLTSENDC